MVIKMVLRSVVQKNGDNGWFRLLRARAWGANRFECNRLVAQLAACYTSSL